MDFYYLKAQKNPAWGQYNFYIALLKIFKYGDYDHSLLVKRLEINGTQLTRCINVSMYLFNISQIYNFNLKAAKVRHFDLICK
jgi:hypothetical protein